VGRERRGEERRGEERRGGWRWWRHHPGLVAAVVAQLGAEAGVRGIWERRGDLSRGLQ
jgi:hypothetical protein